MRAASSCRACWASAESAVALVSHNPTPASISGRWRHHSMVRYPPTESPATTSLSTPRSNVAEISVATTLARFGSPSAGRGLAPNPGRSGTRTRQPISTIAGICSSHM